MPQPDFWDFVLEGGWDLLFPDDEEESYKCHFCNRVIKSSEKVEWVDRKNRVFKCPQCKERLELN